MVELHGGQLIAGDVSCEGTTCFEAIDPRDGQSLGTEFFDATEAEVDRALRLAAAASGELTATPPSVRAEFLGRIATEIEGLGAELIELTSKETGLPAGRLEGERGRTCAQLRMFADLVAEGSWVDVRVDPANIRTMLRPIGPVVVFGASNFPLAFSVAGGDTASALAAGCPVVVKAHPHHPGASELAGSAIARAVAACGLPAGTFSLVHGTGHEVGLALVRHPAARAVGFTGSLAGGRALFDAAAARSEPIPVYAEMGSTNPVFLLPARLEAETESITEGMFASLTLGAGQFCTNPGLVFVTEGAAAARFTEGLAALAGDAAAATMLHEGIRRAYDAGRGRLADVAGVREVGSGSASTTPCGGVPSVYATDDRTWVAHPELACEVFGPATLIVSCTDGAAMLDCAGALHGQLTATVHAAEADHRACAELVAVLEAKAGRLVFNGFPTGVEVCTAMHHGGPYPATTDARTTSVGTRAIDRFARPVCYQGFPAELLPSALRTSR